MKKVALLVAMLALVSSAMAWDINEQLEYKFVKNAYQQAGDDLVLPQIIGTQSGAYVLEPSAYCPPNTPCSVWGQVDNKLVDLTIDREQTAEYIPELGGTVPANPTYSAEGNNFYARLTQGGTASMSTSSKDTITTTPEISGSATAYQNMWVGGEFAKTEASFDSRAIIGFKQGATPSPTENFVVTDTVAPVKATIDADKYGAGYFNTANMGVRVLADIQQNYVGSGWATPTYSGGIEMWANFAGACDPTCSNPIVTSVSGSAWTGLFPATNPNLDGSTYYWNNWATDPRADETPGFDGI
ncbi:MAG: hypothetical protein QW781_00890 [Methanothrix sp.]